MSLISSDLLILNLQKGKNLVQSRLIKEPWDLKPLLFSQRQLVKSEKRFWKSRETSYPPVNTSATKSNLLYTPEEFTGEPSSPISPKVKAVEEISSKDTLNQNNPTDNRNLEPTSVLDEPRTRDTRTVD